MMTTVMADLKNVSTAYMNLCDAYLTKPIRKSELGQELRTLKLIP
jgi:two-component system chemotaxis response regulator CheY